MARNKKTTLAGDDGDEDVNDLLARAVSEIRKHWGQSAVFVPGDTIKIDRPSLPTGILPLDEALGNGGFVVGSLVELFGLEGAGKSTICIQLMAEAQKRGLRTVYIDQEQSFNSAYARKLGVNVDEMYIAQPESMEMALGIVESLVRTGEIGLVVIDSLASLVPISELEKTIEETSMGAQAKKMSEWLRRFNPIIAQTNTLVVFTNQMRDNIGMYGGGKVTPGGRSLKFYASYRLEVAIRPKVGRIRNASGEFIGNNLNITTVKNRYYPPFKVAEVELMFGEGVDKMSALLDVAVNLGVVGKSGNWYKYIVGDEELTWNGKTSFKDYLMSNAEVYEGIVAKVEELL
jgi:recombination protein RecA